MRAPPDKVKEGEHNFFKSYIHFNEFFVGIFVGIVKKKNIEYLIACWNSENHIRYDTTQYSYWNFCGTRIVNFFNLLEKYNFALENEQKLDILSLELLSDSIN